MNFLDIPVAGRSDLGFIGLVMLRPYSSPRVDQLLKLGFPNFAR